MRKLPKLKFDFSLALVFFWFGVIFVGITLILVYNKFLFFSTAVSTTGEVVEVKSVEDDGQELYSIKVKFDLPDGRDQVFTPRVKSNPLLHRVGKQVKVFYNPEEPNHAEINSIIDTWFLEMIFGFFGVVFGGFGGVLIYHDYAEKKTQRLLLERELDIPPPPKSG